MIRAVLIRFRDKNITSNTQFYILSLGVVVLFGLQQDFYRLEKTSSAFTQAYKSPVAVLSTSLILDTMCRIVTVC